ncbi:MAG: MFS transporter [Andreesenia angusta]|nr:MFS transporter [Andreesenia angusta]
MSKKIKPIAVFILFSILVMSLNLRAPLTSASAILDFIAKDLNISETYSGFVMTVPLLAFAISSLFIPSLGIKYGYSITIFISSILIFLGEILRISFGFKALLFGTALIGLGISTGNVLIPSIIKLKFPNRLGLVTGLYGVAMNLISASFTGTSLYLVTKKEIGWRVILSVWIIISFITMILWFINLFIRKDKMIETGDRRNLFERKGILKSKISWAIIIYMGSQSFLFYTTVTWLPKILYLKGFDYSFSSYMITVFQISALPLSLLIPIIADKMKNQKLIAVFAALGYLLGSIGLLFGRKEIHIIITMVIMAIGCSGAYAAAIILIELRSKTSSTVSLISGLSQSIGYIIAAIGPVLLGYLLGHFGNYQIPLLIFILISSFLVITGLIAGKPGYIDDEN